MSIVHEVYFKPALISFLSYDHMLVIESYADRVDITIIDYNKTIKQSIRDMFIKLYKEYSRIHEHSMCLFVADDYFLSMVDTRCLSGRGVRLIKKFVPISNLHYHLSAIAQKYVEGKMV